MPQNPLSTISSTPLFAVIDLPGMVTIFAIYRVLSVLSLWFLSFASHTPLLRWLVLPESDSLPPDIDPFYAFPANLSSYGEGQIIRSRPVAHGNFIRHVGSVVQVLYRTNNTQHEVCRALSTLLQVCTASGL